MAADSKKYVFNPFTGNLDIVNDVSDVVDGPASATDEAIARYDGTTGKLLQNSGVTISDADVVSGATQLNVDNLRLDGNTVSSTDTDGDINLDPDGTGEIIVHSNILPNADDSLDIGSAAANFQDLHIKTINSSTTLDLESQQTLSARTANSSSTSTGSLSVETGNVTAASTGNSGDLTVTTGNNSSSSTGETGALNLTSGNKSSGTANSGGILIKSGNATADTGPVQILSGVKTAEGNSGNVSLNSGFSSATTGASATGTVSIGSGSKTGAATGTTGNVNITSGANSGANSDGTGAITVQSGNKSTGTADSGVVTIASGTATANTGAVTVSSGNATVDSGDVTIQSGTAGGTRGDVILNGAQVDASSTKIVNVTDPTAAQDAATKAYVDATSFTTAAISSDVTLAAFSINLVDTSAARALTLPAVSNNRRLYIVDSTGSAEANNITITPASGTINGDATYVINSARGSVHLVSNGSAWFVL